MIPSEEIQPRRINRRQFLRGARDVDIGLTGIALLGCESDGIPKEGFETWPL